MKNKKQLNSSNTSIFRIIYTCLLYFALAITIFAGDNVNIEKTLKKKGLVEVRSLDKNIIVDLKYSSTDNFLKTDAYDDLDGCYLRPVVAQMLVKVQEYLNRVHPGYRIKTLDCVRPRSVQWKMWKIVKNTPSQKYVANPAVGSIHNYGAAVDLTVVDSLGNELDMGTPFDFFGDLAQPRYEKKFLNEGKLTVKQIANRKILRDAMTSAGFIQLPSEWWHFDAFSRDKVKQQYNIIE